MSVAAVVSQKGGVGKTTLTLNLGLALADRGWRVLIVDTDPQGGIGLSVGPKAAHSPGLAGIVNEQLAFADCRLATRRDGFHLLPTGSVDITALAEWSRDLSHALPRLFSELRAEYDVILVDTPAGFDGATLPVMTSADFLISPLQAEPLALRSITQLIAMLGHLKQQGCAVELAALVPMMVQSRNEVSLSITQEAFRLFPTDLILEAFVPRDAEFLNASARGVPVALMARRPPPVAAVFSRIAAELESRLGLEDPAGSYEPESLLD